MKIDELLNEATKLSPAAKKRLRSLEGAATDAGESKSTRELLADAIDGDDLDVGKHPEDKELIDLFHSLKI